MTIFVLGTESEETLIGTDDNDLVDHWGSGDDVLGFMGCDRALFFDARGRFSVQTLSGVTHVIGLDTAAAPYANQDDLLINVEQAQFLDRTVDLATTNKNVVLGTTDDDSLTSGTLLTGTADDDIIEARGGNDDIDGGDGNDIALFFDFSSNFTFETLSGITHVTGLADAAPQYAGFVDRLTNVEELQFLDTTIRLDDGLPVTEGTANNDVLVGGDCDERLNGLGGNDVLDGRGGWNVLDGGTGNDTYLVSSPDTTIKEAPGAGFDQALSSVSVDLSASGANLEQLVLTGSDDIDARGDDDINRLSGNDGDNFIYGAGGTDVLRGGLGQDDFYYHAPDEGGDEIADFDTSEGDRLVFHSPNFGGLATGSLSPANFVANTAGVAQGADDFFVFDLDSQSLYFDSDGSGAGAGTLIARFGQDVVLGAGDLAIA